MQPKSPYIEVVSLNEEDFSSGQILFRHDRLIAHYAWDTGIAIGYFLGGLKAGVILGAYCSTCRKTVTPPRIVCEWCFRPMQRFVELSDTGKVNTFSICYITWDVKRISEPEIPAVIEIDGASPGHGFLHKLAEVDPNEVHIGMKVQAVWKPPEERCGSITDILYFRKF
ncbi:MAG: Zn-ribbon domain-containing OB-fold protein [Anaerolineales bacterium]|nr:Zn-ribbon domain-containing OB-fold protein [Anaerolineales bacterium]